MRMGCRHGCNCGRKRAFKFKLYVLFFTLQLKLCDAILLQKLDELA